MPCTSCCDLDSTLSPPAYRPGDIHTWAKDLFETASNGCPICHLIWDGISYFVEERKLDSLLKYEYDNIDIQLASSGMGSPLTVHAWNDDGVLLEVEFFATPTKFLDAPWSQFSLADLIAPSSGDAACFECIRTWVAECEADHPECADPLTPQLPTRVIDINPTWRGNRPYLWETNGVRGRYTALSYVWGSQISATKGSNLTTTTANLARHKKHIPWHSIPKTIQDAMTTTLAIGLRYIWVDALAILQDDVEDWARESGRMAEVYANATLTVAATSTEHAQEGMFKPRQAASKCIQVWPLAAPTVPSHSSKTVKIMARCHLYEGIYNLPLQRRAWTLQEHVLSRRVVQYTSGQLVWHCRSARAIESRRVLQSSFRYPGTASEAFKPIVLKFSPNDDASRTLEQRKDILLALWDDLVHHFSERRLTQAQDKLPAMSGLAKHIQTLGNGLLGRYLAGMWETELVYALTWTTKATFSSMKGNVAPHKPRSYRAPSWSWASVDGPIDPPWKDSLLKDAGRRCHVVDVHCELSTGDPTGKLRSAYLILRGRCVEGTLSKRRCTTFKFEDTSSSMSSADGVLELDRIIEKCRDVYTDELDIEVVREQTSVAGGGDAAPTPSPAQTDSQEKSRDSHSAASRLLRWSRSFSRAKSLSSEHKPAPEDVRTSSDIDAETFASKPAFQHVYSLKVRCFFLGIEREARQKNFGEATALLLVPSTTVPGAFERVGLCQGMLLRCFDEVDEQNVKIV
ncbi:hypothetical protein SLS60_005146 [Paraconiothyrium brasiliense]|uniref:Heterokaryon incompatibility domain-containing protein n=1 Tax=Paraconiothyrium brasiliense TaxID=300254 RepID=A0ABR3RGZ2_9PLEO